MSLFVKSYLGHFNLSLCMTAAITFTSASAHSWGVIGHKTAAQIALITLEQQNSPALAEIKKIMGTDDFILSSIWSDQIKGSKKENWSQTNRYHYEKIHDQLSYVDHLRKMSPKEAAKGGIVQAMIMSEEILKNNTSTLTEKKDALRFLIHFIGDSHQPLHTGPVDDSGGNGTRMNWKGFSLTLHEIWDSQIIALGHKALFAKTPQPEQVSKYAYYLLNKLSSVSLKNESSLKYDNWIAESMAPRTEIYKYLQEDAQAYTDRFLPLVDERVYLAGLRMAFILNRIFPGYSGFDHPTIESTENNSKLRQDIETIVGDLTKIIRLKPIPLI
jgi:S1/P1 Nuclease